MGQIMPVINSWGRALAFGTLLTATATALAQSVVEQAAEHRFQLDFRVNDAALAKMLPAGWETVIATQGPAKDCNLRMIFIDRMAITMLVPHIKADLHLSDTQIALALGPAFAFSYALAAIPFGWASDRFPRRWVIFVGSAIWALSSAATALA